MQAEQVGALISWQQLNRESNVKWSEVQKMANGLNSGASVTKNIDNGGEQRG